MVWLALRSQSIVNTLLSCVGIATNVVRYVLQKPRSCSMDGVARDGRNESEMLVGSAGDERWSARTISRWPDAHRPIRTHKYLVFGEGGKKDHLAARLGIPLR